MAIACNGNNQNYWKTDKKKNTETKHSTTHNKSIEIGSRLWTLALTHIHTQVLSVRTRDWLCDANCERSISIRHFFAPPLLHYTNFVCSDRIFLSHTQTLKGREKERFTLIPTQYSHEHWLTIHISTSSAFSFFLLNVKHKCGQIISISFYFITYLIWLGNKH